MRRALLSLALCALGACHEPDAGPRATAERRAEPEAPGPFQPVFRALDTLLTPAERATLRRTLPDSAVRYHMSLGLFIRNEFIRTDTALVQYLLAQGLRHRDDMSDVLLRAYGQHLRGAPIDVPALVRQVPPPPPLENFEVLPAPDSTRASRPSA